MDDEAARALLGFLEQYFEAYPKEDPENMSCADLMQDLESSLP